MTDAPPTPPQSRTFSALWKAEDWMAIWLGGLLLLVGSLSVQPVSVPQDDSPPIVEQVSLLKPWLTKPGQWNENPGDAFLSGKPPKPQSSPSDKSELKQPESESKKTGDAASSGKPPKRHSLLPALGVTGLLLLISLTLASAVRGLGLLKFIPAFICLWLLGLLAFLLAGQEVIRQYNLEYVLWGLLIGLIICNTIGTPQFLRPAICGEFYIKTGLVLLGAEIVLGRLLALGIPGICIAWVVTPIVLISTFIFGQKVLKIPSPSLNMVISADMSVCGVSAAIATAAACRAKKEELSCAVGLSLSFTAIMMVVLPAIIGAVGMDETIGGAWMGGTIDATGAVAAAGAQLGPRALEVATVIKMIQNILIGVVAFGVAIYWTTVVEPGAERTRPSLMEIWRRFPKFVLGFVAASVVFSLLAENSSEGAALASATVGVTKMIRTWLFCLAFICIGLETHFRTLAPYFASGKPLVLYACGQTLNLVLTLFMAWLMFGVVFKSAVAP